jgi:PhnB protein
MATNTIPKGYHTVTPFLAIQNVDQLIQFAQKAFGATVVSRLEKSTGAVMHAELKIGNSMIMLGDVSAGQPPSKATLYLYVDDADAVYKQALQAGAKSIQNPTDQFYGDHAGGVTDPGGNQWWIATHIEDVPEDELKKRARKWESEAPKK